MRSVFSFLMAFGFGRPLPRQQPRVISQQVYQPDSCDPRDPLPCQAVVVQVENPLTDPVNVVIVCESKLNAVAVTLPARMRVLAQVDLTIPVQGDRPCYVLSYAR